MVSVASACSPLDAMASGDFFVTFGFGQGFVSFGFFDLVLFEYRPGNVVEVSVVCFDDRHDVFVSMDANRLQSY